MARLGQRILLFGATGTIGAATLAALSAAGHSVVAATRPGSPLPDLPGVEGRAGDVTSPASIATGIVRGERFDAVISCMASRTGAPAEAWAIDHAAHRAILAVVGEAGTPHFVQLSAICVQKPRLAFQHAKLAFEAELAASGLSYSIVRPTAFFKSLSGQVARVASGRPFLLFGDGRGTRCKPVSDRDLAAYLLRCLDAPELRDRVLPVGGPGPAQSPREIGEMLFRLLDRPARFRSLPLPAMDAIVAGLSLAGRVSRSAAAKAELARIGRYYARESMLVLDPDTGRYSDALTPETGSDRLEDHFRALLAGAAEAGLGAHAVFGG